MCISGFVSGWFLDKDIRKFKWKFVTALVEDPVSESTAISKQKTLHVG